MIILTSEQAARVSGEWRHHAIEPVALRSGEYCLPVECITNENYPIEVRSALAALPQRDVAEEEFVSGDDEHIL